jgi:hypothetical protein
MAPERRYGGRCPLGFHGIVPRPEAYAQLDNQRPAGFGRELTRVPVEPRAEAGCGGLVHMTVVGRPANSLWLSASGLALIRV